MAAGFLFLLDPQVKEVSMLLSIGVQIEIHR